MKDEVRLLREELTELKAGAAGLADQVGLLSSALVTLSDLQTKQAEQEEAIEQVTNVVVPREEHELRDAERAAEQRRYRHRLQRRIVTAGVVLVGLVCGAGIFIGAYINGKNIDNYNACQLANQRVRAQRAYLEVVRRTSPVIDIREAAQRTLAGYALTNCGDLR